ncbi:VOC family protein [Myxococcota bacterium]|nr:VOC family protein [Myxococcota bacterium]
MSALPYAGAICWRELSSTNPAVATKFYRDLFSWTSKDVDMGPMGTYTILNHGEEMVAGAMQGPNPEIPSHWINYVTVDDVDASAAQVVQLGGQVFMPPTDAPEIGRFAIVADPEGAVFGLLRDPSGQTVPAMNTRPVPGTFCWAQLMTRDVEAAKRFYTAIFGWKVDMYEGMVTLTRGDGGLGSIMPMPAHVPAEVPAYWENYVAVDDLGASYSRALALGAKSLVPPTSIPNTGDFALVATEEGATIALWKHGAA